MSNQSPDQSFKPVESNNSGPAPSGESDRGLFDNHGAQKHECHHYTRMYGGQVLNAMMVGFGMTLGADAANALSGRRRSGGGIEGWMDGWLMKGDIPLLGCGRWSGNDW